MVAVGGWLDGWVLEALRSCKEVGRRGRRIMSSSFLVDIRVERNLEGRRCGM